MSVYLNFCEMNLCAHIPALPFFVTVIHPSSSGSSFLRLACYLISHFISEEKYTWEGPLLLFSETFLVISSSSSDEINWELYCLTYSKFTFVQLNSKHHIYSNTFESQWRDQFYPKTIH
jgi:hypothetical protein